MQGAEGLSGQASQSEPGGVLGVPNGVSVCGVSAGAVVYRFVELHEVSHLGVPWGMQEMGEELLTLLPGMAGLWPPSAGLWPP